MDCSSYTIAKKQARSVISSDTTQYRRYVPVRQQTGTRTTRYRAILSIGVVSGFLPRYRPKSNSSDQFRSSRPVTKRYQPRKKREKREKKRKHLEIQSRSPLKNLIRCHPSLAEMSLPPHQRRRGNNFSSFAQGEETEVFPLDFFSPRREKKRGN
ncbi:hypothetical protein B296_00042506, partial [Ensete ventricosum]